MEYTADNKLVYTGDDPIVWSRVNAERIKQGLPGLADIGLPKPADDGKSYTPYQQYTPATGTASGSSTKFNFNFGGENFTVNAPAGTTEAQARAIFDQQASTGSLTGLQKGQSLSALTQFSGGLLSAASQLGKSALSGVSNLASKVGSLTGVPVGKGMNVADFVKVGTGVAKKIGALDIKQVQGLMAQSASAAGQASTDYSLSQGIGKFGINPTQLESSGFLKPGTLAQYGKNAPVTGADIQEAQKINASGGSITAEQVATNRQIQDVLKTSTVWTGKDGVGNLGSLLGDANKQAAVQVNLLENGFKSLNKSGLIPDGATSAQLGSLVQTAGKFGAAAAAAWAKGASPAGIVQQLNNVAKQGQFAVNFTDSKVPAAAAGVQSAVPAFNTVNRKVLNQSVTAFIGDAKVPSIDYGQPVAAAAPTATPSVVSTGVLNEPSASDQAEFKRLTEEKATLGRQVDFDDQEYNRLRSIYGRDDLQVIAARDKWEADLNKYRAVINTLNALVDKYPALLYY